MTVALPDVEKVAQADAARINANREAAVEARIVRVINENARLTRAELVAGVTAFHTDRMSREPNAAQYPDAKPWVDHVRAVDARVRELAGLDESDIAVMRSMGVYLAFRGMRQFGGELREQPSGDERCRVAFIPETDRGALHIKNVDDPITYWTKRPPFEAFPDEPLVWDGTGSGLHIDDEPAEIFPLPITLMCKAMCTDVPSAIDFLSRYKLFWGNCNVVLFDKQRRSVAIEKCSYNHLHICDPDARGRNHCSGMSCRDADSPIAKYQAARRLEYRQMFDMPDDGSDNTFWQGALKLERKLGDFLRQDRDLTAAEVLGLFSTPRAEGGLNKDGDVVHPDEPAKGYTLCTNAHFLDERSITRWQRDPDTAQYAAAPEVYQF